MLLDALNQLSRWSLIAGTINRLPDLLKSLIGASKSTADYLHRCADLNAQVAAHGVDANVLRFVPTLTRNWDYYTSTVFQIVGMDGSILASGGRYDELATLLGSSTPVPSVGFVYLVENMLRTLDHDVALNTQRTFQMHSEDLLQGIRWTSILRDHKVSVVLTQGNMANSTFRVLPNGKLAFDHMELSPDDENLETILNGLSRNAIL
jgi:histidyl-tRNA synthetase